MIFSEEIMDLKCFEDKTILIKYLFEDIVFFREFGTFVLSTGYNKHDQRSEYAGIRNTAIIPIKLN